MGYLQVAGVEYLTLTIMSYSNAKIIEFTEEGAKETSLEETNHYRIMKQFFEDKDRLLHHLLNL
ncbi:hypothetical protein [Aneurinibacillus migulanus]|uniref:Uncharacterized protein n=1 Tax=Aneurinibacillus migulanus TaxID=47500 RepID=A0A0D1V8W2_ANEMI|nr:hypothetical protein TS65_14060 [Aneurinibacillus migulanus]KON97744.1 hypothetical protein AF333_22220 [Aneurinibacillus migulanus]KON98926.1 hypothetical protein AF333_01600 [Aneurinibacillus migulanus]GED18198.1 hypothetical protein AMI01nite_61890 [Aneurinibacillus migulanus]SDK60497.1 hypothetical protein SAMN04487909_1853 [Aneurinibacillus migulanus]